MNRVIVTGASGYIGRILCRKLIDYGFSVTQLDKKNHSDVSTLNLDKFFGHDLIGIVHLAATSGITVCQENQKEAFQNNVLTTKNISEFAEKHDLPVIFSSSMAVKNPESSLYASMKFSCEQILEFHNKSVILRFSNVYGGYNYLISKSSVVSKFLNAYKLGRPMLIDGDGKQTRDFIHVDDICEVIIKSLTKRFIDNYSMFEVGTGEETSILELAKMIGGKYEFKDESRTVGVSSSCANIEGIWNKFGIKPSKDKLKEYIDSILFPH